MPRKAIDYSNTIIYKIVCKDLNIIDIYVGHTTSFKDRKREHKSRCKTYNFKLYVMIRENGGWDNWDMIEIEKYSCKDKNEARARERYWYEKLSANINMRSPIITDFKEWTHLRNTSQDRREYMRAYMQKRREDPNYPY